MFPPSPVAAAEQQQRRLAELRREQAQLEAELQVQQYAADYAVTLRFPARLEATKQRTDNELVQHRLLEAGLLYDVPVTVQEALRATTRFVEQMEATGCYNAVHVEIGAKEPEKDAIAPVGGGEAPVETRAVHVRLDEANWYHLKVGGGVRGSQAGLLAVDANAFVPHAEAVIGLRNLAGVCDKTSLQYTLDTHSMPTYSLVHSRPLYTALPGGLGDLLLEQVRGSQCDLTASGQIETQDYQSTRSYQEFQRFFRLKASSSPLPNDVSEPVSSSLQWTLMYRDIVPRRHAHLPFAFDASTEIVSQAWPSGKHSLQWDRLCRLTDHPTQPTEGLQYNLSTELALPPGDVGFLKTTGSASVHKSFLGGTLALHAAGAAGYLHHLGFGGLTRPPTVSDRFFIGGPLQLRGFSPAGIGPRARTLSRGPGDALGGDFYYTGMLMASFANASLQAFQARFFGFCNVGTCVGSAAQLTPLQILASSRAALGVGMSTCAFGPRVELTYAWPIRTGPRDVTRRFQFGLGFTFG